MSLFATTKLGDTLNVHAYAWLLFGVGWWCVECDVKDVMRMMWRNYSAFGESPRLKDVSTPSLMRNIHQKAMMICNPRCIHAEIS